MKYDQTVPLGRPTLLSGLSAALLLGTQVVTHAADLTFVNDIPTDNVLQTSSGMEGPQGSASSQGAFGYRNLDAAGEEGTRGRGQSFLFSTGSGDSYTISSLSISLNSSAGNAIRPEGDAILTVFEWDNATNADDFTAWDASTGAIGGTEVFSGTFPVAAGTALNNGQLFQVSFDPGELTLEDGVAYGYFVRYVLDDVTGLGADVTLAFDTRQDGTSAGALLNTNKAASFAAADNGQSTGRDMNYFITGTVEGELLPSSISTTTNPINSGDSLDLDIGFDPTAETATLTTPGGAVDLIALDDGSTNGDPVAGDGMVVVTETPASSFTYDVVATKTGGEDATASLGVSVLLPSDVTTSATAPTVDVISSTDGAGVATLLFDEDANTNHARGQLFTLIDGPLPDYEISSITVKKSTTQSYANDTLTLRIFEGTGADWDSGTGHDTPTDGSNYYVDTTVTPLYTESFNLSGEIVNNDYVTFALTTPIAVSGDSDLGFFMTYDRGEGGQDTFGHRENGTGGGRLSITTTDHGSTAETSRRVVYFVQGTAFDDGIIDPTIATATNPIELGNSVDLDITFDPTVDTATLTTPGGPVDLKAVDAGDGVPNDGMVTVSDSPVATYSYLVNTQKAGEDDSDASLTVYVVDPSAEPVDNAFSTAIKGDSPLFYYRFEDSVGAGALLDSSGNANHTADIVGNLVLGSGPGGMQNAGQVSDVGILVPATSDMGASFTATAVVTVDNYQAGIQHIFSITDGTGTGRSVFYPSVGELRTFIDGTTLTNPGGTVPPNETTCLLHLVYDADPDATPGTDDQEVRFYINGVLQGAVPTTVPVATNVGNWVLGSNKFRNTQFLNGWIDETAVFESVLTDGQIAAHGTAFFAAADPLLGFTSDVTEITAGDSVELTWKTSNQASVVTINGNPVDGGAAGGVYSVTVNPTVDTTYIIDVDGETREVTVTVTPLPRIVSISADGSTPPNITLVIEGEASTTYNVTASPNLVDGFSDIGESITTDANGDGSTSFTGLGTSEFYRLETTP